MLSSLLHEYTRDEAGRGPSVPADHGAAFGVEPDRHRRPGLEQGRVMGLDAQREAPGTSIQ